MIDNGNSEVQTRSNILEGRLHLHPNFKSFQRKEEHLLGCLYYVLLRLPYCNISINNLRKEKAQPGRCKWSVDFKELRFDEPPEIIGRGTFGLVLLANYRGTEVAVKRVLPSKTAVLFSRVESRETFDLRTSFIDFQTTESDPKHADDSEHWDTVSDEEGEDRD